MINLKAWDNSRKLMTDIRGYADNDETIKVFYKDGGFVSCPKDKIVILHGSNVFDKNNKEIFEGDIHFEKIDIDGDFIDYYIPILFENGTFWLDYSESKDKSYMNILCEKENLNIVGTIYDNPELLRK